jgi:outer membrane lipoprotein SlyB
MFGFSSRHPALRGSVALLAALFLFAGCATYQPPPRPIRRHVEAPPPAPEPAPSTQVYVYPTGGQSEAQLDRDRYECHAWAVKQSGFDPSLAQVPSHQRVQVMPSPPPAVDVAAGAATGAIVGAAVSRPRDAGGGAIIGAIAGAVLGAATGSAREQQAEAIQHRYDERDSQASARLAQQAGGYRRALGACLEGRGYTVK